MTNSLTCQECNEPILGSNRRNFCSQRCYVRDWRRRNPERNRANYIAWNAQNKDKKSIYDHGYKQRKAGERPARICSRCSTPFHSKNSRKIYCSRKCLSKIQQISPASRVARRKYVLAHPEKMKAYQNKWNDKRRNASPWLNILSHARARAKQRGLPYDLTPEWAEARWTGNCELTGLPFSIRADPDFLKKHAFRPSTDRIIPSKGYVQDNCRFILFALNSMKADADDAMMLIIADALLKYKR